MRLFTIAILWLAVISLSHANVVVVVAKHSEIQSLEDKHVANIFLARTSRFPNGEKARPIELKNEALRNDFYLQISGKSSKQLYAYWTTLVFTGKGKPPRSYGDGATLQEKLLSQPGGITYLPLEQVTADMKIVYRFP